MRAVSAVVLDEDGRVLLVRRAKPPLEGVLTLPGGRLEADESPPAGAAREVREETGLEITRVTYLTEVVVEATATSPRYAIEVHAAHLASGCDPDGARAATDAREVVWARVEELTSLGVPEDTRRVIALALRR